MKDDLIGRHEVAAWLENMGYDKLAEYVMDTKRFPTEQTKLKIGSEIINAVIKYAEEEAEKLRDMAIEYSLYDDYLAGQMVWDSDEYRELAEWFKEIKQRE